MLYEELRRSIPQLANLLLSAEEDKTKANAAGALSNLVRNSNKLCEDIVSKGAMQVTRLFTLCIGIEVIFKKLKIRFLMEAKYSLNKIFMLLFKTSKYFIHFCLSFNHKIQLLETALTSCVSGFIEVGG